MRYSFIVKAATKSGRHLHKVVETSKGFEYALDVMLSVYPGRVVRSHLKYFDRMNPEIKDYVNALVKRFPCVYLRFNEDGKVFLFIKHWTEIYAEDAKKVFLGYSTLPKHKSLHIYNSRRMKGAKVLYIYEPLPKSV